MMSVRTTAAPAAPPVLLALADRADAQAVRRVLEAGGLANPVRHVTSAVDATAYLAAAGRTGRSLPAVVLTGLHLSPGSACDVLHAVGSDPALQRVPVLVVGDGASDEEIEEVHRLGAAAYLARPVLGRALLDVVRGLGLPWSLGPTATPAATPAVAAATTPA